MSGPDPKPARRIVDPTAVRASRLAGDECAACGRPPGSTHHVIPRGEGGDDVAANLLMLCGSGTTGCHGALHGSAYMARVAVPGGHTYRDERRDAEWVAQRLGHHIAAARPDTIAYVLSKLGTEPGRSYLLRRYRLDVPGAPVCECGVPAVLSGTDWICGNPSCEGHGQICRGLL